MIDIENLFLCWNQFKKGKRKKLETQYFERHLEDSIFDLHDQLSSGRYQHGSYKNFYVSDPKKRYISKASIRDRLVHQVVYTTLTKIFDPSFLFHSLSCRTGKGTHVGIKFLHRMIRKVSQNGTKHCFALKMDIKKFFNSINHHILTTLIRKKIKDEKMMQIINIIIDSFYISNGKNGKTGLPLGNVSSQLFANIYLNELDIFVKQQLHQKYYLRYCDDFIILSNSKSTLKHIIKPIQHFLKEKLFLELHPQKISLRKSTQGIDFLGYIVFATHKLMRTSTKRRMQKRLKKAYEQYLKGEIEYQKMDQKLQSYLGMLSHANQYKLSLSLKNAYWIRQENFEADLQRKSASKLILRPF